MIFLIFDDTFFVHTIIELLIFAREYLRAHHTMWHLRQRSSHDMGIFAQE